MEHPILTLINKPSRLVIGFMSGTSADGVDAALVRITGCSRETKAEQLEFCFVPFEAPVRAEILRLAGGGAATAADFCRMNFLLGKLYCEAGLELCRRAGVAPENIDLILAPALSCDRNGYRLGYGGGYYDRFLARTRAVAAALCAESRLTDELPREPFDLPCNYIITERQVLHTNEK